MGMNDIQPYPATKINPWKMLAWLFAAQVSVAFIGRSLAPLGLLIGADLSLSMAQIGMLPAALFLGQSLAAIPIGYFTDLVGSRRVLLMLSLCLGLSFLLMTLSSAFVVVLVLITLGGIGYGSMHPASNRGIIYWFTAKKRGTAMGIKQMGVTFGSALSALLLLPLASEWGWRPVLLGASMLLIVVGFLAFLFYKDPPPEKVSAGITSKEPSQLLPSIYALFKHKALILISICAMGLNGGQMALNTYLVLFAYEQLGINLVLSGILLVISEVSGSFGRIIWGMISDRLFNGKRIIVLIIISFFSILLSLTVAFLPTGTSFWVMALITVFLGFCMSGFNGIWMNTATELVPREQSGIASGFSITLGSLGVIVSPPLFGLIVDKTGSFMFGWLFLAVVMTMVIAVLVYTMRLVNKSELDD
ncbi:MFS transporter [Virgibacillus phasianinus]|uniref:MFS transporter n=1 Tax=Virgibacillus phasianinus TaxID=2017483 RepID=A0A220U3E4_9BACI|nr:MFS transporter [Virgibacillus phasianinus]ASK62502.1 MFS transporter [Virgibacillus phasianinus]